MTPGYIPGSSLSMNNVMLSRCGADWYESRFVCSDGTELTVFGRGYAFIDDSFFRDVDLIKEVARRLHMETDVGRGFRNLIPKMNGGWAIIVRESTSCVLAATDRFRTIPILYGRVCNGFLFSNALEPILNAHGNRVQIDDTAAAELFLAGYVSGSSTVYKDVFSLQAGEIVEANMKGTSPVITREFYFTYYPKQTISASPEVLMDNLEDIIHHRFELAAKALRDRPLVLPLSAGYDSRLIGCMLKRAGIEDIGCYTYGALGNQQVEVAKQVAEELGFKWMFVPYDAKAWAEAFGSEDWESYLRTGFSGTACPHMQDFAALYKCCPSWDMSDRPIFLPGHVGDAWANEFVVKDIAERASHPPSEYHSQYVKLPQGPVVSSIVYRHLNLWPLGRRLRTAPEFQSVFSRIAKEIDCYPSDRSGPVWQMVEWVLRSRTAHWINNSCRAFEYFGGGFHLCLADYEIIDFFRSLPLEQVQYRALYHRTMRERFKVGAKPILGQTPVMSGGKRKPKMKRRILQGLNSVGIFKPMERVRRRYRKPPGLSADTWFTSGRAADDVTIGEALAPYNVERHLPDFLLEAIRPLYKKPAYSIQCNGLLAVVVLSKLYAQKRL